MSLLDCDAISYPFPESFCIPVTVDITQNEFDVDPAWMAGATFLGLALGAAIVLLCARPFLESWDKKKKRQDEEKLLESGRSPHGAQVVEAKAVNGWVGKDDHLMATPTKEKKGFFNNIKGIKLFKKKELSAVAETEDDGATEESKKSSNGMIDIMIQTNNGQAEVEMANQDMSELVIMEKEQNQEKNTLMFRSLALLLKKRMEKKMITKSFYFDFVKKTEEDMKDLNSMLNRERDDDEKKLKNDPNLKRNPQELETEMDKLASHYSIKTGKLQTDYKQEIRLNLLRGSGMSEAEVDDMMGKLMQNMAVVEEKIGLEQARQRRALEQRLAKRRQALEFQEAEEKDSDANTDERVDLLKNLLSRDLSQLEKQNDEIITDYSNDLCEIKKFHRKEFDGLMLDKYSYLKKDREHKNEKLKKKHDKEKAAIVQLSEKTAPEEFIKLYHDLMVKHHTENELLNDDLDQKEVQEMHKLKQDRKKEENKALDAQASKALEKLENTSDLTSDEAHRILKLHKQQVAAADAHRQKEKQAMLARLDERLHQRLSAADEAEARDQKEQEMMRDEQLATINKVLATNMDLSEDAKERILREHEQNMQALSNKLMHSKLRQQKSLEIKLNQRKARLVELKKKQEDQERSTDGGKNNEKNDRKHILAAEIAKEEADFEVARKTAVADLRRRLAEETSAALKQQDEEIGLLIGRLQVGQARRKAILERQDVTLKQLQDELEKKVAGGDSVSSNVTDQILQQHYNQVTNLNEKIQQQRNEQQQKIMEKLTRKKTTLENEIETQLEEDAQKEYSDKREKGAGYASLALMQGFLEQRHSRMMSDLQAEMTAELEKHKNDLNTELELELKKELEVQKSNLLTQLAKVKNVSSSELKEAYSVASKGSKDNRAALKLVKDLKNDLERSKTSMNYSDNRRDEGDYQRTEYQRSNTDMMSSSQSRQLRKGSAKTVKHSPKRAFGVDEDSEDDDGF